MVLVVVVSLVLVVVVLVVVLRIMVMGVVSMVFVVVVAIGKGLDIVTAHPPLNIKISHISILEVQVFLLQNIETAIPMV